MKTTTRGFLAASVLLWSAQSTAAHSADDILERHLAALRGRPAVGKVTSPSAFLSYEQAGSSVTAGGKENDAETPQVEDRAQGARGPFDYRHVVPVIVVGMFIAPALFIAVLYMWFEHRSRVKALDVLRVYAERNEEPPASVTQVLTGVGPHITQAPKPPSTRGHHLAHVAANVVFALGAIGIIWWKAPDPSNPGGLVIFAILAGLFFAAGAAARIVGAIYARE